MLTRTTLCCSVKRIEVKKTENLLGSPLFCSGWRLDKWRVVNGFIVLAKCIITQPYSVSYRECLCLLLES